MSRSWTPPQSIVGPLSAGVTRMADLFGFSPGTLLQELVDTIANHLVGREVQISFGDASVRLTVTHAHVTPAPAGLMLGQLGSVELEARDVQWADRRVDDLAIEARNVHVSAGNPHALVAAPILFTASLTEPTIAALVADANPRVSVTLAGERGASVRLRSRETWGHIEVEPRIDGSTLVLQVTGVAVRRRRPIRRWLTRVPAIRRPLQLPPGVVLDDVAVADRRVVVHGALREWREPVSAAQLEELITRVRSLTGGALDIPRHTSFSTATPPTPASPTTSGSIPTGR